MTRYHLTGSGVCDFMIPAPEGEWVRYDEAQPLLDEVLTKLDDVLAFLNNVQSSSGVCMCGDDMRNHPAPTFCGHSPVDSGEYHQALYEKELQEMVLKMKGRVR